LPQKCFWVNPVIVVAVGGGSGEEEDIVAMSKI
jgi:hypothetical protein